MNRPLFFALVTGAVLALGGCSGGNKQLKSAQVMDSKVTTIGVNAYLWRAALDTVSFMPLLQANPDQGVIITDWYVSPRSQGERMKLTVTILDTDLRPDALRVAASREVINERGQWITAPVQAATVQKLEDVILTRARDLRRSSVSG